MFLKKIEVDEEEESIRKMMRNFPDERRAKLYAIFKVKLKDPDTYAALNWSLVVGFHHLYLGKYLRAISEWLVFLLGVYLLLTDFMVGLTFIVIVSLLELYELFRSQIIVQDFNNKLMLNIIRQMEH